MDAHEHTRRFGEPPEPDDKSVGVNTVVIRNNDPDNCNINFEFSSSNYNKVILFEMIKGKKKNLRITVKFDSSLQKNQLVHLIKN